ncbi:hypothetical protein FA15DRAFT_373637 [Coprinopsis marcescibilis]|uniref:Aip3p/Bud6 N-terminal domain-containing protein n=1 Tax=Coprinopsis marcescibilis TaxID=230819 RepID=A0A5C3KXY8_COPMA|nr:hypothetical protein FA15DRAFT_373637 [Coprinopsis marcescibilis]
MASYSPTSATGSRSSASSSTSDIYASYLPPSQGDVPAAVQSLLSSTRRLQEVLKDWSRARATVTDVSDVYVQIGTEFNVIIQAFAYHQIDLSDIHSVPQDMRNILEVCLAEEPTQDALNQYLPELKQVLVKLLRGLETRQDLWQSRAGIYPSSQHTSPRNSR